ATQPDATVVQEATIGSESGTTTLPDDTPAPSQTPLPETVTPTATEITTRTARVDAQQPVNVREGPGRSFAVVGVVQPDDLVEVLDENEDTTWYKILLEDGKEGWISAELLKFEAETASLSVGIGLGSGFSNLIMQITATTPPESQVVQVVTPVPLPYENERWYGMTLGIIVIIVIIIAGNVLSLIRRAASKRGRS
ncbi:MAG: SH3 domain-containing protein, partial [Anaerolineae bacterium]|nr:SH3 domain-containing protein [Anaerolineae bacterium]